MAKKKTQTEPQEEDMIKLSPEVAIGTYSNMSIVGHGPNEFVIDFASFLPGMISPNITNRLILTPLNAKRLTYALLSNMKKYEKKYGEIDIEQEDDIDEICDTVTFGQELPSGGNIS